MRGKRERWVRIEMDGTGTLYMIQIQVRGQHAAPLPTLLTKQSRTSTPSTPVTFPDPFPSRTSLLLCTVYIPNFNAQHTNDFFLTSISRIVPLTEHRRSDPKQPKEGPREATPRKKAVLSNRPERTDPNSRPHTFGSCTLPCAAPHPSPNGCANAPIQSDLLAG